jgi:RNA polymerase sigma factor (sigma-70 family)
MTDDFRDAVSYALRVTQGGRLEREDLEQEVYMALLLDGFDLETIDRALLFTIAKRTAIDYVRKHNTDPRKGTRKDDVPVAYLESDAPSLGAALMRIHQDPSEDPEAHAIGLLLADAVREAMEAMPEPWRAVMELHLQGKSKAEMAKALGIKEQTVRFYLMKARMALTPVFS